MGQQVAIRCIAAVLALALPACRDQSRNTETKLIDVPATWAFLGTGTSSDGRPFLNIGVAAGGCERFDGKVRVSENSYAVTIDAFNQRTVPVDPEDGVCTLDFVGGYGVAWLEAPLEGRTLVGECQPGYRGSATSAQMDCLLIRQMAQHPGSSP